MRNPNQLDPDGNQGWFSQREGPFYYYLLTNPPLPSKNNILPCKGNIAIMICFVRDLMYSEARQVPLGEGIEGNPSPSGLGT